VFKEKYQKSEEVAVASNLTSSVLLVTAMDDNLINMGHSREMTNRIQKLRKGLGISIDDQIEVFFQINKEGDQLSSVLTDHSDQVRKVIKMPFMPAS
jgi:hypothetical protein